MGVATRFPLKKGALAPEFKNCPSVDGHSLSLSDFSDKKVLVIFFSCNHCPYVQAYEDRIMALQTEFASKGVQFIAINSNDDASYPDDSFDNMKKRATERHFNFVYLRDQSQDVAKAYEATHTPHLFVFNEKRELAYTGKIDDNWQFPDQVKQHYLRDVLQSLTEGKEPALSETYAIGCTIKWRG